MCSALGIQTSLWMGCPIRNLGVHGLDAAPPKRFAGLRVLHRFHAPRHPPRTLCSLFSTANELPVWLSLFGTSFFLCLCCTRQMRLTSALSKIEETHLFDCSCAKVSVATPTPQEWKPVSSSDFRSFVQRACSCSCVLIDLGVDGSCEPSKLPRKEVIQPHLPVRLPCYDFTPITDPTLDACFPCGLAQRLQVLPTFVV